MIEARLPRVSSPDPRTGGEGKGVAAEEIRVSEKRFSGSAVNNRGTVIMDLMEGYHVTRVWDTPQHILYYMCSRFSTGFCYF